MKILALKIGISACLAVLLVGCAVFTPSDIGKDEYQANCATCHGSSGKGDGPQAEILPTKPADLTLLAKNNGGEFPASRVHEVIDGRLAVAAHGSRVMPVWGDEFLTEERQGPQDNSAKAFADQESRVNARVRALVDYLKQLQE